MTTETDTIIKIIQSWLDWQQSERDAQGLPTDDDTAIMSVPVWPSRRQLKNWITYLRFLETRIEELTNSRQWQGAP